MALVNLGKFLPAVILLRKPKRSAKMEAGHPRNKNSKNVTSQKDKALLTTKETQIPVKKPPKHSRS